MPDSTVPFSRSYGVQENTEVDEGPRPGTIIEPIPEHYAGTVFPYRGTETHGVHPMFTPVVSPEEWEGGMVTVDPDKGDDGPPEAAMPVRIVQVGPKEIDQFRVNRITVDGQARLVVNRMPERESFRIKNLDGAKAIYVSDQSNVSAATGWRVDAGQEFTVDADNEVYAISADGTAVEAVVLLTYSVAIK